MNDCVFCKVITGEIPSKTIYEDDIVKVFLDINPTSKGECLIIPKNHYSELPEMDDEVLAHMSKVSKIMYAKLKDVLNFDGLKVEQNNGIINEVKHYHIHLIPAYDEKINIDEVYEKLK